VASIRSSFGLRQPSPTQQVYSTRYEVQHLQARRIIPQGEGSDPPHQLLHPAARNERALFIRSFTRTSLPTERQPSTTNKAPAGDTSLLWPGNQEAHRPPGELSIVSSTLNFHHPVPQAKSLPTYHQARNKRPESRQAGRSRQIHLWVCCQPQAEAHREETAPAL
jgi:hypothetical protein